MPTIKDVAREAGVSIATVSYVLNNKLDMVSESTYQLVMETAKRIGYVPNVTARNLKSSQSRLIGYAWHAVPNGEVNSVLDLFTYYLAQAAEEAGYHILTFTYPLDEPLPVYNDLIRTGRVDGFVLASTTLNDPRIEFLLEQGFPFVSFGRSNPDWDFPWVDTDGQKGIYDAVTHLIGLGHRDIAMIAWPQDSVSGSFRTNGYLQALHDAGIAIRSDYIFRGENHERTGYEALEFWCSRGTPPTAVVSISDLPAIGVLRHAEDWGLIPGKTLSVIGFDDSPVGQYLRPSLTTLRQPIPEISATLIEMLQTLLTGEKLARRQILLPPRLIIRESSGAPR